MYKSLKYRIGVLYKVLIYWSSSKSKRELPLILSYQKSGRTWVRFFVANYLKTRNSYSREVDWDTFTELTPGLLGTHKYAHSVLFSHDVKARYLVRGRRVVFVTRNPLDIAISYYYFHKRRNGVQSKSVQEFVAKEFKWTDFIRKTNKFQEALTCSQGTYVLPYEELLINPDLLFRELIEFLFKHVENRDFVKALENSKKESMSKLEVKRFSNLSSEDRHVRSGTSGGFSDKLEPRLINSIKVKLESELYSGPLKSQYLSGW